VRDVPTVLLIGEGDLAEETRQALDAAGADVYRVKAPEEREVRHALEDGGIDQVVVVSRQDAVVLRTALMVRDVDEAVPMLVTIFDPTMAGQVDRDLEHCDVTSMADIVAPSLAGPCLGEELTAIREDADPPVGIRETEDGVQETPIEVPGQRRAAALVSAVFAPYDKSAALLVWGALGLIFILVLETIACMAVLGQGLIDASYGAAKTLVTVDPNDEVADGPKGLKAFLTVSMLAALVFEASFTAGLVNRLVSKRLTGLFGRRAVPRRDHVVVVGMGQVGLRLCLLLRRCGIGIVAVDDREEGENVGLARELGFPVVVGRGADPSMLRRLSLQRACALAAVTDDDLQNISIAMAARSVNDDLRIVLRAGDGRVANETRSLFRIGLVRDVHRIAAVLIAARATGSDAHRVVCVGDEAHLLYEDGRLEEAAVSAAN
jgi:siroheme synthase (precorrin-2 oxidase/ferrochelatase)